MDNETIELIKRQSITEAARLLNIEVKRKMSMCYTGHDKNPSLSFNEKEGYFKCFGCDAKET
jgi:DNA primase